MSDTVNVYWPDGRLMQRMSREEYDDALELAAAVRTKLEQARTRYMQALNPPSIPACLAATPPAPAAKPHARGSDCWCHPVHFGGRLTHLDDRIPIGQGIIGNPELLFKDGPW